MARVILALLALLVLQAPAGAQERRIVTDAAGRRVALPTTRIDRIMPAGPPAAVLLYALYPETMVGWVRAPAPAALAFLPGDAARIGTVPRLTGSTEPDVAAIRAAHPELIIDYGMSVRADVRRRRGRSPRVYYGRGADGLAAVRAGTVSAESLAFAGATNVVDIAGGPPFPRVTIERIAAWNPDVVIFAQHEAFAAATGDPAWQRVAAVREHRVYAAPELPFGFVEEPPSVNRLIGLPWLGSVLYPETFGPDPRGRIGAFYTLFYRRAPSEAELTTLLRDALPR